VWYYNTPKFAELHRNETSFFMLEEWIYSKDALKMYEGQYLGPSE